MDHVLQVTALDHGERLDKFIASRLSDVSRSFAQQLINEGKVQVSGQFRKANFRVSEAETVTISIPPPQPTATRGEDIPLRVLYEDDSILVIDKPAGMVVHPAVGHASGTLVNAVLGHSPDLAVGNETRPGIVHRLDRDTSGLIVIAKQDSALKELQRQFASHAVKKVYLALVHGRVTVPEGKIDAPLARDPKDRKKIAVVNQPGARQAVTIFRVAQMLDKFTLLQVEPQTGRTHQIRVHLAFIHHPIVGDPVYSRKTSNELGLERQFLHAARLAFRHPANGAMVAFDAPLPDDLGAALQRAGGDPDSL